MVYLIQLVYLNPGKEPTFQAFEDVTIPRMALYGGELLLRVRPTSESVVAAGIEVPYEIHVARFGTEEDFARFSQDEVRQQVLRLKSESVRHSMLVRGFEPAYPISQSEARSGASRFCFPNGSEGPQSPPVGDAHR